MLLSLTKDNIEYLIEDYDYIKYGNEPLIVFKKVYCLENKYGNESNVLIYIKIKDKADWLPVISFHENE